MMKINIRTIFNLSLYLGVTLSLISCTQGTSQQDSIVESTVTGTSQAQNTSTPRPTPTISPSPTTQPTNAISVTDSGWVEYQNESIGFSFQHPEDWLVTETETGQSVRTGSGRPTVGMMYTISRWDDVMDYDATSLVEFDIDYVISQLYPDDGDIDQIDIHQITDINKFKIEDYSAASAVYRLGSGDHAGEPD